MREEEKQVILKGRNKGRNKFVILMVFTIVWMLPLFFEQGLLRYAFEELRVLTTGLLVGYHLAKDRR